MKSRRLLIDFSLSQLCAHWQLSRQSYYQGLKRQQLKSLQEDIILELVREQKHVLPQSGGLKMLHLIRPDLSKMHIDIGRDRFFRLLRSHDLLVKRKRKYVYTTDSNHPFKVYTNRIKGLKIKSVFQVLVADITYIRTLEGFLYLALLTDLYSRKIIAWDLSDSLELEGCLRALKRALRLVPKPMTKTKDWCIHHSDRGSQYCSYAYTDLLKANQIGISMAAAGNCYENATAERINGILKSEFALDQGFTTKTIALKSVQNAVDLYNYKRPHRSLNMNTPQQVFDSNFNELFCF